MPFDQAQEIEFDEAWYLRNNPGVASAVSTGAFKSGLDHYIAHGRLEGRLPSPGQFDLARIYEQHNHDNYLSPTELSRAPTPIRRIALIGSCMMEGWVREAPEYIRERLDLFVTNGAGSPPVYSGDQISAYDFQIVQIALRGIISDETLARLPYGSIEQHEVALKAAEERMAFFLQCRMSWSAGRHLLTFVTNFFTPQNNAMGALFPRYDLRNPEYFVDRLNQKLESLVRNYNNAYVLDIDRLAASIGRRHCQDDGVAHLSHGTLIADIPSVNSRMEAMAPMREHYDLSGRGLFISSLWASVMSMYRVARQQDAVKMVVVDLDDTLWSGISGDMSEIDGTMVEGWPFGLAEALLFLKKRGILLAIASKNEESRIREIWPKIFGSRLQMDDFAVIRINWQPKAENMREILESVNLLPRSALFIDDNPAERSAMSVAFPEMRVIGRHPYYLRRALLWSPETQVASITNESARRTEMIQAQMERESFRQTGTREDFLAAASPRVTMIRVRGADHLRFHRCFELLNKTNQFNTTGRRWTQDEITDFFAGGGEIHAFDVADNFAEYGLVGAVLVRGDEIIQWAMSCRVLGLEIEIAVMAALVGSAGIRRGTLIETDANFPCRDLFAKCGFILDGENWRIDDHGKVAAPFHIILSSDPN